jgi:hypothetical protein
MAWLCLNFHWTFVIKTAAEVASHPKARLHRELVVLLRAKGSIEGAKLAWREMTLKPRLWNRLIHYGLGNRERQWQLNMVAFPEYNRAQVDAALEAGNNLRGLYDLACGRASIVRDADGYHKLGRKGLKIIRHAARNIRSPPSVPHPTPPSPF